MLMYTLDTSLARARVPVLQVPVLEAVLRVLRGQRGVRVEVQVRGLREPARPEGGRELAEGVRGGPAGPLGDGVAPSGVTGDG